MGVRINVDLSELVRLQAALDRVAQADTEPLMTNIGGVLANSTVERFDETKAGPDGTPWPPNRTGTELLIDTTLLHGSIAFIASADHVEVGSNVSYAHVHQFGATIEAKNARLLSFVNNGKRVFAKRVTIPARPFLGLSDKDAREVEQLTTDWLGLALGDAK